MRLYEDIDFTTLAWVKPELDETLRHARIALESYVEDPSDAGQMRYCATYLHQVHGTLRMVELYGAAMVAEEMEQLARALSESSGDDRDDAYAVLMRGIVQLPDYLERLQGGHRDIPIVLLPLLNELREARGEKGLGESALFSPDLGRSLPQGASGPASALNDDELRPQAERLRSEYQSALLNWMRADSDEGHITALTEVCDRLVGLVEAEPARRLFWVAAGTLEALRAGAFEASKPLKQALARVEREIKRLADEGEGAFRSQPPLELTRQLLYYVAHAPTDYGRINEMREVFALEKYLPSEAELAHARGSMTGHNRALLDTVSVAIKEDLLRVKDALDLHLRSSELPASELGTQVEVLDRVGDTLGMLGLGIPRRVVQEQRQAVLEVSTGQRPADEGTLLDIAGALLYVEASLDDQVAQLGHVAQSEPGAGSEVGPLSAADARKVLEAVVKEAVANFAQARQCFVAFVETNWDSAQLDDVPRLMNEVGGALRMLEVQRAPDYLTALRLFTEGELVQRRRVPNAQQLETLADALSALEYFLEALRDQRGGRERILDTCEQRLLALGYWPLPASRPAEVATPVPAAASVGALHGGFVEEARAPAPAADNETDTDPVSSVGDSGGVFDWPDEGEPAASEAPHAPSDSRSDAPAPGQSAVGDEPSPAQDFSIDFDEALAFGSGLELESVTEPGTWTDPGQDFQMPDDLVAAFEADRSPVSTDQATPATVPEPQAPVEPVAAAAGGFAAVGEEIDDEIREVFLEEFQEEIENLGNFLPAWSARPADLERLRPIRRVFHTLKGSGRLVGALTLGEFSWRIENALNRVLDGSREASPAVVELIEVACRTLPELRDALSGEPIRADIEAIKAVADRIAAGEDARVRDVEAAPRAPAVPEAPAAPAPAAATPAADVRGRGHEDEAETASAVTAPDAPRQRVEAPVAPAAPDRHEPADSVPVALDPVLFEILKAEVQGHLETVDAWVEAGARYPQRVNDPLLRAVHTMNGAFAMTEVPVITDVTSPLEGYIARLLATRMPASASGVVAVSDAASAIRRVIASLEGDHPSVPVLGDLGARLAAERDLLPEPAQPLYGMDLEAYDDSLIPETVDIEAADLSAVPDFENGQPAASDADFGRELETGVSASGDPADEAGHEAGTVDRSGSGAGDDARPDSPVEDVHGFGRGVADETETAHGAQASDGPVPTDGVEAGAGIPAGHDDETAFESESGPAAVDEAFDWTVESQSGSGSPEGAQPAPVGEPVGYEATDETVPADADADTGDAPLPEQATVSPGAEFNFDFGITFVPVAAAEPAPEVDFGADAAPLDAAPTLELPIEDADVPAAGSLPSWEPQDDAAPVADFDTGQGWRSAGLEPGAGLEAGLEWADVAGQDAAQADEPDTTIEADTGADAWAGSEAEADAAAAAQVEPEVVAETRPEVRDEAESETAFQGELEAELEASAGAASADEPRGEPGFETVTGAETQEEPATGSETDADAASAAAPQDEPGVEAAAREHEAPETGFEVDAAAASEPHDQTDAESEAGSATELQDTSEDEFEVEADAASATQAQEQPESAAEVGHDAASGAEPQDELGAVSESSAEAETEVEPDSAADAEAEAASAVGAEADADAESEARPDAEAEAEAGIEADVEAEADPEERLLQAALVPEVDPDQRMDLADLDIELLDLFLEEAQDLLDHSDELLAGLREAPEDRELITGLQRDLHTLKGGARMAGVPPVGELGHVMESLLEAVAEGRRDLGRPGVRLLEAAFDRLHRMVLRVGERQANAMPDRLVATFEALSLGQPIPAFDASPVGKIELDEVAAPTADLDREPQSGVDGALPGSSTDTGHEGPVDSDHAGWPGVDATESVETAEAVDDADASADAEPEPQRDREPQPHGEAGSIPDQASPDQVSPDPVPAAALDETAGDDATGAVVPEESDAAAEPLKAWAEAGSDAAGYDEVFEPAASASDTQAPEEPETAPGEPAVPAAQAATSGKPTAQTRIELPALSAPLDIDALGEEEDAAGVRAPQEQVRIRADLLDRLVNYAGEVAIYRARLEQQLGSFRGNLGELDATTNRLRDQLRKLEIETEAQIIARYQREPDAGEHEFDPLELDRFSTLQQLTRALSESAADLVSLQGALEDHTRVYETLLLQQSRVSSDLQEGLMRTRMVPFDSLVPRLRRVLRQAGTDTSKQVQLKVEGAQGEMDRSVLERMTAPLEHMLRNAVAHGLELPADRVKAGKPAEGTVRVEISREGSEVVITVADDGRGLDLDAIRTRAVERGLLAADAEVAPEVLQAFILETGFSTAGEVSRLAGRGVGMDVVHNEIRQLGGVLAIRSEPGRGSEFQIRLPFTLAVTQAVFVKIGETSFAVPIASVQGVGRIARGELEEQLGSERPVFRYGGEEYAIHDLGQLIGQAPARAGDSLQMPVLLARSGELRVAICIDQVLGSREVVVKPVGPQVSSIPGIFGATVMGDGSVVVILDVAPLVRRQVTQPRQTEPAPEVETRRVPLVMVVDDSITMRKVTGRVLERNNFEVLTAKDGVDAIEKMADRVPDLMLLDVEMPRMDGYELATHMRNDGRLLGVPIIMITSRTGEKHRQRAFEIGVNRYLGKPYQEAELMRNVHDLLAMERSDD